jgi:hypothetical protein
MFVISSQGVLPRAMERARKIEHHASKGSNKNQGSDPHMPYHTPRYQLHEIFMDRSRRKKENGSDPAISRVHPTIRTSLVASSKELLVETSLDHGGRILARRRYLSCSLDGCSLAA